MNAKQYKQQRDNAESALRGLVEAYYSSTATRSSEISAAWNVARDTTTHARVRDVKADQRRRKRPVLVLEPTPMTYAEFTAGEEDDTE